MSMLKKGNKFDGEQVSFYLDPADEIAACRNCVLPTCVEKNPRCLLKQVQKSKKENAVYIPSNISVPELLKFCKPITPLEERLHGELEKVWDELDNLKERISKHNTKKESPNGW